MKFGRIAVVASFALCVGCLMTVAQAPSSQIDTANSVFQTGKFAEAEKMYEQVIDKNPKDVYAAQELGYIALLANRLDDAQKWLEKSITLKPDNSEAKIMLAEAFYRRNDFSKAATILKQIGPSYARMIANYPTLIEEQLEAFAGQKPYDLHGRGQRTAVAFVKSEPLPVVNYASTAAPM
jgi:predicted Zn-dependent protease